MGLVLEGARSFLRGLSVGRLESSPAAGAGQIGGAMRASYSIHPPARGESVAWRVVRVYRDGVRRVGSIILDEWARAQDVGQTALDEPGVRSIILEGRPVDSDEWRRDVEYSLEDEREAFGVAFHTLPAASGLSIHEQRGYWLENSSTGRVVSGWFSYSMSDSSVVVRRKVGGRRSVVFSSVDRGRFVLDSSAKPGVSTAWGWSR
jgi:hypothetical protein